MARITDENRGIFSTKTAPYRNQIKEIQAKEKSVLDLIAKDQTGNGYKKIMLCEEMIFIATLYMNISALSMRILETKNEDSLNEARKALYKAVIYLEEIVTNYVDAPFSEYQEHLREIANIPFDKRYFITRKLGLAISLLIEAYGENSKWKWAWVELQGRFAIVLKNIMDMQQALKTYFDSRSTDYDNTVYYFRMLKRLLSQAADGYRDRYELSTKRLDDMRLAINYLNASRRIFILLEERDNAEEAKKKAAVWTAKMESDEKKAGK